MSALEFALAYRELGLSVIPVCTTGKRKSPHAGALHEVHGTSTWKPFRDQPATKDEIRGWYQVAPDAGVAILTGCLGDVLVADIDDRGSAPSLPTTPIVTTGRGFHVYLRGQARKRKTAYGDLLGSGSYAIAPPSRHPTGAAYSWQIAPPGMGNVFLPEADFLEAGDAPYLLLADPLAGNLGSDTHYTREVGVISHSGAEWESEEFAWLALQRIALEFSSLGRIVCPFHPDGRPSAGLFRGSSDGGWVFKCQACDLVLTLGQLFAKTRAAALTGPTVRKWWDRLLFEAGGLELPELPPVLAPPGTGAVEAFVEGFLLLARIDAYGAQIDPRDLAGVPYTASFGVPWTGISKSSFDRVRGRLLRDDWLQPTGWLPGGARRTRLWLPRGWEQFRSGDST